MPDAVLETERLSGDRTGLERAAALLRAGALVAFPTETVYGLGADATNARAVAAIYAAKERPSFNPLISHVADLGAVRREGTLDVDALKLAGAFWPGPLTLVVPRAETCRVCDLACAGLETIALRIPAHPLARDLLARVGVPLAAPSANRSGRLSATSGAHVLDDLDGRIAAVLDAGAASLGIESTIVACLGGGVRLLRPGAIATEAIEAVLGSRLATADDTGKPAAPGMLASHYAPHALLRLDVGAVEEGEVVLLFGRGKPADVESASMALNLSESGDLEEAAAHLFDYLRRLDAVGPAAIAVTPIPQWGLGEAINDRLRRAGIRSQ